MVDVRDQGRWHDRPDLATNGMAIMRGLVYRVNVRVGPSGTHVSLVSCAIPQLREPRRACTVDRDRMERAMTRAELALGVAVEHCHRARTLLDSAQAMVQAGQLRRQARATGPTF